MGNNFKLIEVNNKTSVKQFLDFPSGLYKNDKNWVRYLDPELEKQFDPRKNKTFKSGEAIRWILLSENKTIGRIAAFYDKKTSEKEDQPTGGIGFFDCINNQEAASFMFDAARSWLQTKGMEAMDGPINFGSRETFWGCLKEGFHQPVYNMPYNFAYYNDLFENYGFMNFFNQFTYHVKMEVGVIDPKIKENALKLNQDPDISYGNHDVKNPQKTAADFLEVFNAAWAKFPSVKPLTQKHTDAIFKNLKQVLDPRLLIFTYHKNRPIAFFLMIPDLNPIIKKFNGKFHLINKLRLFFELKIMKSSKRALGLIFGVVPEFQGHNITDGMINFCEEEIEKGMQYTDLEMNWIGDFNPKMINMIKSLNADVKKTHITYRYLFDRNLEFKRAEII